MLTEAGDLSGLRIKQYCIIHSLDGNGNLTWTTKVCIKPPLIPRCCPPGQVMKDNTCQPSRTPDHLTPPISAYPRTPSAPSAEPAIDDEFHFLIRCPRFNLDRNCFFTRFGQLRPNFITLSDDEKFKTLLCPTSALTTKLIHRFIKQMFTTKERIKKYSSRCS